MNIARNPCVQSLGNLLEVHLGGGKVLPDHCALVLEERKVEIVVGEVHLLIHAIHSAQARFIPKQEELLLQVRESFDLP